MNQKTIKKLKQNIRYPKTEEMKSEACKTLLNEALSNDDLLFVYYFGDEGSKEKSWVRLKELRKQNKQSE
jgi:hypothetical protein